MRKKEKQKKRNRIKHTVWCYEGAVKLKKELYEHWIKSGKEEDYINYQLQCSDISRIIKKAKQEAWERFGKSLADNERTARREKTCNGQRYTEKRGEL